MESGDEVHHAVMCWVDWTLRSTWVKYFSGIPAPL